MMSFEMEMTDVNVEVLDADLRNALPSAAGIRWDGREVTVYLADDATPAQVMQARRIAEQHDPQRLSATQQEAARRQERMASLREQNAVLLDEAEYTEAPGNIQALARRVVWLEQEILALRQGG